MAKEKEGDAAVAETLPQIDTLEFNGKVFLLPYRDDCIDLNEEERRGLKASIQEHGIIDPIVINKRNNHVLGGRNRLEIAKELELPKGEVPLKWVDIDDESTELSICMNLLASGRGWTKTARRFSVKKLFDRGHKIREIARMLRTPHSTVQVDLEKLGLKPTAPSRMRPARGRDEDDEGTKEPRLTSKSKAIVKINLGLDWVGGLVRLSDMLKMPGKYKTYLQEMSDWLVDAQKKEQAESNGEA
jgi:hypothetical protein